MAHEEHDRLLLRRRLLGWSPACAPIDPSAGADPLARDLCFTPGPDGRVLATTYEVDNLAQALQIALTTRLGDDPFDTGFGFDGLNVLVEETNPVIARERIRIAVIGVLRRDPRVRRIVDLQVGGPSDDPRALGVRVVFETVAGEQLSTDLQGVVANA